MPDTSTILSLPYILPSQAQKHVTHNEAIRLLDVIVQLSVTARNLATPPVAPQQGDRYVVATAATGAWAGKSGQIALFEDGAWQFFVPISGWTAWVESESVLASYHNGVWVSTADGPQTFGQLGISATSDATNRLTVSSPATLLNHAGAGHQLKLNKAAATDTASLLFQTGFSGRAEMGTAGNDDFSIKVSPDGSAFLTGLSISQSTGQITLPAALRLGGQPADPVSPVDGMIWLNSTTGQVKLRSNGAVVVLASINGVANAQLANMATATIKGRISAGAGAPEDLTGTELATLLPTVSATARGLAPASGGGTTTYLRADGTWATVTGSATLPGLGLTATAAQINTLATPISGFILAGDPTWNRAVGAGDVANTAFWATGTAGGITSTIQATGIDTDGQPFVDVALVGTTTSGSVNMAYVFANSRTPATIGQIWTASAIIRKISGAATGGCRVLCVEQSSPNTSLATVLGGTISATADAISTASRTIAAGNQVQASTQWVFAIGTVLNEVYRIKGLQLELGATRTPGRWKELTPAEGRTALGLGTAALLATGTTSGTVPVLGTAGKLPASTAADWGFTSGNLAFTNGGTVTVAHGLGAVARRFQVRARCLTAEAGLAVGDEIPLPHMLVSGGLVYGATAVVTATNIVVKIASAGLLAMSGGSGATMTPANFALIVEASL